jgi:hypothetical protein
MLRTLNELASIVLTWQNFTLVGNIGKSPNWPMCRHLAAIKLPDRVLTFEAESKHLKRCVSLGGCVTRHAHVFPSLQFATAGKSPLC